MHGVVDICFWGMGIGFWRVGTGGGEVRGRRAIPGIVEELVAVRGSEVVEDGGSS